MDIFLCFLLSSLKKVNFCLTTVKFEHFSNIFSSSWQQIEPKQLSLDSSWEVSSGFPTEKS